MLFHSRIIEARWCPPMNFRFRYSSSCSVVCLALLYIVVFNGLSLYGLIKSTYTPVSLPTSRSNIYLAYLRYDRFLRKCKNPHLSKKPLPLTALASFPGSGNTWVRHILQEATGESNFLFIIFRFSLYLVLMMMMMMVMVMMMMMMMMMMMTMMMMILMMKISHKKRIFFYNTPEVFGPIK